MALSPDLAPSNGHLHLSSTVEQPLNNFGDYSRQRSDGLIIPFNSKQILWQSLSTPPPVEQDSGFIGLGVFTDRIDKLQIFGVAYPINAIAEVTKAAASNPHHDKGIVLYGPTGSGKSSFIDVMVKAVETTAPTIPNLVGIKGCPINEDPDHLLNLKVSRGFVSGDVKPHGELCPCCQIKFDGLSESDLKSIELAPLKFRSRTGEQIVRLQPADTRFRQTPEGRDRLMRSIQKANRGLLIIDEMGDHESAFFHEVKDLFRDGDLKFDGLVFPTDMMIITHTTSKEWRTFSGVEVHRPVVERLQPIPVSYNLDKKAEVNVYEKGINALDRKPHIAPDTLETWAEVAVSTRLAGESAKLNVQYSTLKTDKPAYLGDLVQLSDMEAKRRIKIDLYSGKTVPGFRLPDVKEIQQEGIIKEEGMSGLSPVAARGLFIEMMGQAADCISPKDLFTGIEERLTQGGKPGYLEKADWNKVTGVVKRRWEEGLIKNVLGAFRSDMEAKIQTKTDAYIEECELLLDPSAPVRKNPQGDVEGPNIIFMAGIEQSIFGKILSDEERGKILRGLPRPGSQAIDKTVERAKFDQGIEQMVLDEGSYRPEDVLRAFPPNEKDTGYIEAARRKLEVEGGFCAHCAKESIEYVAQMIRKAPVK